MLAEVECGGVEWQFGGGHPEIKLIATATAGEAVEEIALQFHREAAVLPAVL